MSRTSSDQPRRTAPLVLNGGGGFEGLLARATSPVMEDSDFDYLERGLHPRLHDKLGVHPFVHDGRAGVHASVWAPGAEAVSLVGDFNEWAPGADPLVRRAGTGVWEGFVAGVENRARYRFHVAWPGGAAEKADPYGRWGDVPPGTASRVWASEYSWQDGDWLAGRAARLAHDAPIAIYEVHVGSWRAGDGGPLGYRELADPLIEHVHRMGFTHVELLPIMEHPYGGSWGYQSLGYFSPTARFGTPDDLRHLIDRLHQAGIGVILDWVPSHFAVDDHGLVRFDGTALYEHPDPRRGFHPDWGTYIFDYTKPEVRSFLLSSAFFWLDEFHADGLRVDAVASMLYLDYSRNDGEWLPNRYGGNENLEAIEFLRTFNDAVYAAFPGVQTFAEESTAWPGVSSPSYVGGLGFGYKWDMGWMHDTLQYLQRDPVHRSFHHGEITFRAVYAFTENYTLPLSHDEVVHLKKSLLGKMPGDEWQQRANLRLLLADQFAQPGKKLLFMGGEFGQTSEWADAGELEWGLLDDPRHAGILDLVQALANLYRTHPALHAADCRDEGFAWVDANDAARSSLAFVRRGGGQEVMAVFNFTSVPRDGHRLGVDGPGSWRLLLDTDEARFGGSGYTEPFEVAAEPVEAHGREWSIAVDLPPLAALFLLRGT